MKFILTVILVFACIFTFGQKGRTSIDTSNYYEYAKEAGSLNWLRISDVVPIIIEEIKEAGFSYAFINTGELIKVNDTTHLVLTVSYDNEIKFGFVYDRAHGIPLNKKDRDFMNPRNEAGYTQAEKTPANETNFMRIEPMPANIFLLKETCYWFEFGAAPSKVTVTKPVAENILRQDIRNYLERIKK